jgi:3-deoxy-7-phosphoheptulonate synthase
MQKDALNNVHITDEQVLITPDQLKAEFPLSIAQEAQIAQSRQTISDIIAGAIRVCWWYVVLAQFTILKPH